ncbi:hypothetical protein K2Y11_05100 [bacterium]|nr:hypothetical protein [bacterium]
MTPRRLSQIVLHLALATTLVVSPEAAAAGFGKAKRNCDVCPPGYPTVIEEVPSTPPLSTAQPIAPSESQPNAPEANSPQAPAPNNAPTTDSALDQSLTGQYDVASASNFSAPNMVGDFFGAASAMTLTESITTSRTVFLNIDGQVRPVTIYQTTTQNQTLGISPGTGNGVGRVKLAENTSILPQDRAYFGYQYFQGVPIGNGTNVNRYVPGFEKTFFNGTTSVEVRVPFAGTLDSTQDLNQIGATNTQLGNVTLFLKGLLYQSDTMAMGGGLSITTPTANDAVVTQNGSEILRIKNQGTHLAPYLGVIWMPNRFFVQMYAQYDVDATGRPVYMANSQTGALQSAGNYNDTSVLFLDWNLGYWIYRNPSTFVTGIAPIFEVHYNQALGNADTVTNGFSGGNVNGTGLVVTDNNPNYSIVNLTAGTHFVFGQRSTLTLAGVLPATNASNRGFNGEFQVLFNYYFGRLNRYSTLPVNF